MNMASTFMMGRFDVIFTELFSSWNIYTTILTALLLAFLIYPYITSVEPDIHPYFLARQSIASTVRQPGESAIYRSLDRLHNWPLQGGLNIRDPEKPKWNSGRDGDLRDIWRQAVTIASSKDGKAKMISVRGRGQPLEYGIEDLTQDINIIGRHIQSQGKKRVAIYLPNSVELLVTLFGIPLQIGSPDADSSSCGFL